MGIGLGIGFSYYRWKAESEKPCRICLGLEGDHAKAPARPHPKCECSIDLVTQADGVEPQLVRQFTTTARTSLVYDFLGTVGPNKGLEVAQGPQVGLSSNFSEVSVSAGWSENVNQTYTYDPDIGGRWQDIYNVFGTFETTKTSVYRRANGVVTETDEVETDYLWIDAIWVKHGEPPFYGEGGAGESEAGHDDGDGEDNSGSPVSESGIDYGDGMSMVENWDD